MSDPLALRVEGLGKRFRLAKAGGGASYRTLRDDVMGWFSRGRGAGGNSGEFWALNDVCFSVAPGEVLGVIGRNGAGKSTLLKVLSRIISPTTGWADIHGRVGSLLEVGTGFHPELTGRENIYLNGAILGMRRAEVQQRFDEIVAFAGVGRFLDTACKHYSSGMYMRLAFAVAAHLETEILFVDEVLAVGDMEFQRKCLGKMDAVARSGRTVLLVSHNLAAIKSLSHRVLVLDGGRVRHCGAVDEALRVYLADLSERPASRYQAPDAVRGEEGHIVSAAILGTGGSTAELVLMSEQPSIRVEWQNGEAAKPNLSVQVRESGGAPLYHFPNVDSGVTLPVNPGPHIVEVRLPALNLYPGRYTVRLSLTDGDGGAFTVLDTVELVMEVEQDAALVARPLHRNAGVIFGQAAWEVLE